MYLQKKHKDIVNPTSDLCVTIRKLDELFDDYHGTGVGLRYETNVMAATTKFILSKDCVKEVRPEIVRLFVKIKLHHRVRSLRNQGGQGTVTRNIMKTAHFAT